MNWRERISVDPAVCHGKACAITKTTVAFDRILDDIVGRILNVVKPRQVFLFWLPKTLCVAGLRLFSVRPRSMEVPLRFIHGKRTVFLLEQTTQYIPTLRQMEMW